MLSRKHLARAIVHKFCGYVSACRGALARGYSRSVGRTSLQQLRRFAGVCECRGGRHAKSRDMAWDTAYDAAILNLTCKHPDMPLSLSATMFGDP
jgi:hypothetical protein